MWRVKFFISKMFACHNSILRCFVSRNITFLLRAYLVYVRPLLEYNSTIWSPHYKYDIGAVERVQWRFTKRLPGLSEALLVATPRVVTQWGILSHDSRLGNKFHFIFRLITVCHPCPYHPWQQLLKFSLNTFRRPLNAITRRRCAAFVIVAPSTSKADFPLSWQGCSLGHPIFGGPLRASFSGPRMED